MKYENKNKGYYENSRTEMQKLLPPNIKTVLDIGCGNGTFANSIKNSKKIEVWGVELMSNEANIASEKLDKVINKKVEDAIDKLPDNYFDVIYFNDVLEHVSYPDTILKEIKIKLKQNGVVISSIPNVRYHSAMYNFLFKKDWKYAKSGVMDYTHLRFFTSKSIKRMYMNAGYSIVHHKGINKTKSIKPYFLNILFLFTAFDMFYLQFATIAKK
ncbi:class I SAM-dependent methyltransferase [Seonamhaeicola algicola]|uniref:Class I SAM-dependent methyltransferase n=2 Tax=Seonamhaeicola TaxID=1649495 RepID=A0A5C7B257_9FLAO|nr:class I SAM-dependent methyltransferase [Seonamhaeicola algicola]TXE13829.1 class I SAM-dependent methyltransferase [Seonamhaeicola algicola]